MSVVGVGSKPLGYALLAAIYRAPLGEALASDFSLFFVGQSGCQKSEITGLAQAHFGSGFNRLNLPANWNDTSNALEKKAFIAKDTILTIDDFAPSGTAVDVASLHSKADRILRGQGNQGGRGRMTSTLELSRDFFPRGLSLSSGEDVPKGHSLGARLLVIEMNRGDVNLEKLTTLQEDARRGVFAVAMAGYIQWLGPQMDGLREALSRRQGQLRDDLRLANVSHDRTPSNVASLALGLEMFLTFAEEKGAIDAQEKDRLMKEGWEALHQIGGQQREQHVDSNPAETFLRLLRAAISSGKCHLKDSDGRYADHPEVWGWTKIGEEEEYPDYRSQGDCIGWTHGDDIFLEPTSSFKIAQSMGSNGAGSLSIAPKTLNKRLKDVKMLATTDVTRGTATVRKKLQGQVREVLHIRSEMFWGKTAEE